MLNSISSLPTDLGLEFRSVSNKGSLNINGLYVGKKKDLLLILKPFIDLVPLDTVIQKVPYIESVRLFTGRARWLPFFKTKNAFISQPFPDQALDIVEYFMSRGNNTSTLAFDAMGGRINDLNNDDTAFVHRKGTIAWMLINSQWSDQNQELIQLKWISEFYDALTPYLSGFVYQNAPDIAIKDYLYAYYGNNLLRLIQIKQKYDPDNVFSYSQSIPTQLI